MAGYNAHRLDVLDYLIPPVKKSHGAFRTEILFSRNYQRKTDVRLIKDIRKKITRGIICPPVLHLQNAQASASVILKKTTEELIHKQYSFLNSRDKNCKTTTYLPINKRRDKDPADKPMIKVTIIPKQTETPMKVFNKRRERTKELQNSVSNLENSVQNNNYYYMVKGKRREKVYEIKTSESTNFSNISFNAKYDHISLQQITSSKRLINSLNMEKKKRKTKKAVPSNTTFDVIEGTQNVENFAESKPVNAHKSKVTIVGQLGLNRDDQYILKCAATVNDKPIETNYMNLKSNRNKGFMNNNSNAESPRNSNTQTDFRYTNNGNILNDSYYKAQRLNSQGTQVNINQPNIDYKNKTVQCRCGIPASKKNVFNIREQDYVIKNGKMPLVVISVYPKHGDEDNIISVKNTHQPTTSQKQVNNMDNNISFIGRKKQQTNDGVLSGHTPLQRSPRNRTPSPDAKTIPKKNISDRTGNRVLDKNKNKQNNLTSQSLSYRNKSSHKFNNTRKDASCSCPYSKNSGKKEFLYPEVSLNNRDIKETDTKQVKRALVNHFLRSVDKIKISDAKVKPLTSKNDTSRVTINIEGDKEHYDLLIEHNDFNTGFAVRKSINKPPRTLRPEGTEPDNSMENFLTLSDEMKKDKSKYARVGIETCDFPKVKPIKSRLNIKDSLEISHRRDERFTGSRSYTNQLNTNNDNLKTDSFNSDLRAPVKHYRGDECSILDPNERDKEIRALLGIVRNTGKPNIDDYIATKDLKISHSHPENQKGKTESTYYHKRSKSLVTGISVSRSAKITIRGKKVKTQTISNVAESDNAIGIEGTGFQATQQKNKCSPVKSLSDKLLEQMFNNKVYKDDQQIIEKPENDNFTNIDLHSKPYYNKYAKNKKYLLNRNVKVYLQIGESNRERYIALNRTQYEKVKRTIQCSSKHHKCSFNNYNVVSIGEIRIKRPQKASYDREVQTERSEIDRTCKQTQYNYKTQITNKHYTKQTEPGDRNIEKIIYTADTSNDNKVRKDLSERKVKPQAVTRRTVSSVDVCFTNGSNKKHMPISSTCFGDGVHDNIPHNSPKPKHSPSIYTIFKSHKKCNSPNLGASAYSLSSEANESMKYFEVNQQPCAGDCKPSKPFFRRLLSCLVMRTPETTGFIEVQKQKVSVVNSSVDAYHLSTSLGAMEMSSSLYDTSVSFYSNHSVQTNKMKRGFFSSVWGLFSVRRN